MNALRGLVLAAALLAGASCASTPKGAGQAEEDATLIVDNQALLDMTIYAIRGGQRVRLGIAPGLTKSRFRLRSSLVFAATPLQFLADPIGSSGRPVSDEITVSPGDEVTLRIPPA